ncbi:hypothetical protein TFLX_04733 [Thermoflexales bacterium]|nr:hypothetical protein TFLX_04733 [Thermoflexales bacterium]
MPPFSMDEWDCAEVYSVRRGRSDRPAMPSSRICRFSASRAAATAIRDEIDTVSMITPLNVSGKPTICRSQSNTTSSNSVADGEVRHNIPLTLRPAVSSSPKIPGSDPVVPK